jgi:hypothetical protein
MYIILVHHTSSHNYQMHACGNWEGYIIQVARNLVWLDTQSVIVFVIVIISRADRTSDYQTLSGNLSQWTPDGWVSYVDPLICTPLDGSSIWPPSTAAERETPKPTAAVEEDRETSFIARNVSLEFRLYN